MLVKCIQMEICILDKKKKILGMEKVNIFIVIKVITLEIGLKEKCRDLVNFMMFMEIYNIRVNGKMIIFKEEASLLAMGVIGLNIKDNLDPEKWKGLVKCFLKMEIDIKVRLDMIYLGVKVECLLKMDKFRKVFGKKVILYLNIEILVFYKYLLLIL